MVDFFNFINNLTNSISGFISEVRIALLYEIPEFTIGSFTFGGYNVFEVLFGVGVGAFLIVTFLKWVL